MDNITSSPLALPSFNFLPTFACLLSTFVDNGFKDYEGYQVLRVNSSTTKAFELLQNIYYSEGYDFWSPPSKNNPVDIVVPGGQVATLTQLLNVVGVQYRVLIPDLHSVIEEERVQLLTRQSSSFSWNSYQTLSKIHAWEDSLAQKYPDLVSILKIGKSFEGRELRVIKLSKPSSNGQPKPAVWLDGGIHAREWISPATVTFMANALIEMVQKNETRYLDVFDWYISPNINPDGYVHTFTQDRMWRKTRSTSTGGSNEVATRNIFEQLFGCCKGSDPNRNFDHMWGGKGTSKNKCSEIYHGPSPASEPEVKAVQDFLMEKKDQIKLFLTFHSYSQMLLLPWGFDNQRTPDHEELMAVANKAAAKLEAVYGTKYQVGPSPELLYPAAGGSEDFAKGKCDIKFSYCFELRDDGKYGFLLPPSQIIPTGVETFEAVKSMADDVIAYYKLESDSTQNVVTENVTVQF